MIHKSNESVRLNKQGTQNTSMVSIYVHVYSQISIHSPSNSTKQKLFKKF